jgi:hypothetical protein
MSEVELGKERIVQALCSACDRAGLEIDDYDWGSIYFDLPPGPEIHTAGPTLYRLSVTIGGRREVVKVTHEEVTDLPLKGHLGAAAQRAVIEKIGAGRAVHTSEESDRFLNDLQPTRRHTPQTARDAGHGGAGRRGPRSSFGE